MEKNGIRINSVSINNKLKTGMEFKLEDHPRYEGYLNSVNPSSFLNEMIVDIVQQKEKEVDRLIDEAVRKHTSDWSAEKENVREALKELFPEAFEEELVVERSTNTSFPFKINGKKIYMNPRSNGKYKGKSICLEPVFKWKVEIDEEGYQCLIPELK